MMIPAFHRLGRQLRRGTGTAAALLTMQVFAALPAHEVGQAPEIDGRLDEAAWSNAVVSTDFLGALQPDGLVRPAPASTRVRVMWDRHFLYFGFECDGAPSPTTLTGHDAELHTEEVVEVFLDLTGQGTEYVELQLSPAGTMADLRHQWSRRPTYAATHIDAEQRRNLRSDRAWNLKGWRAAAALRRDEGAVTGWTAEMAVPTAALGLASVPAGHRLRANFAHYRFTAGTEGRRELQPATWSPVLHGRPHVSPMAMREVRCIANLAPTAARATWREVSRLLVADAHRAFHSDASDAREARYGEAVTLLNKQPRTEANIERARRLFEQLAGPEGADDFSAAARYYLGRIEQVHRLTPNLPRAKEIYAELMADRPGDMYAQLAGVKLCLLNLYASGPDRGQRLAAGEQLAGFFTLPEAKRDYHLAMADAYVRYAADDRRLLDHLLAADASTDMTRTARADIYARIVDAATRVGERRLAIDYCHRYLGLRLRAARVSLIEERLRQLEAAP